jgi:hypothetical protein
VLTFSLSWFYDLYSENDPVYAYLFFYLSSIVFGIDIVEGMSFVACYELPFRTTGICYKRIIKGI